MKNVILGIVSVLLVIYSVAFAMSIYVITIHKNQVDQKLSLAMKSAMSRYYVSADFVGEGVDFTELNNKVKADISSDLEHMFSDATVLELSFAACDMEKGIISIRVKEAFFLPTGRKKTLIHSKTILVDREV